MAKKKLSFEQWISAFVGNVMHFFNLAGWRMTIEYANETPEDGNGNQEYAHVNILSAYQCVNMTVNQPARKDFEAKNFERLTTALVHEIVHIFLDPFCEFTNPHLSETTRPFFLNIVENQTQKLTMVLLKTLPKELIP